MNVDPLVSRLIELALEEDLSLGDVTTDATIDASFMGHGRIAAKQTLVLAGIDVANRVFDAVDPEITLRWECEDGDNADAGQLLAEVHGNVRSLLKAERTVLNFLQRLAGVATMTRAYVDAVAGTNAQIVDTRKTTPGWRTLEKAAVRAGGGANHRMSLGSGILIKDNHIDAGGGIAGAVTGARGFAPHGLAVEVEVRNLDELNQAIEAGADIALLDNMNLETLKLAAARAREAGLLSEASGGVTLATVRAIAECGVDLISVGALTHSSPSVDIHMKVRRA
ncbi:MAG TPA: carboxylating nicotinate-nucleotide diphosphorylase [Myxococcales bacterium]|nr:carboxylating nicotinate-nucleotide diphosphorylase [Myxococcales bacterium]